MKKWFNSRVVWLKNGYSKLNGYFCCIFWWQLFITLFWFSFANLILLVIACMVWLTSLFLII